MRSYEESEGPTSCIPCKQQRDPYDWYGRHEEILKLNKQSAPEVVMIGNSITHFWGGEPIAHNQFGTESWDKLFKGKRVRNLDLAGDKTENVLWRIYHGELDGFQAQNIFPADRHQQSLVQYRRRSHRGNLPGRKSDLRASAPCKTLRDGHPAEKKRWKPALPK